MSDGESAEGKDDERPFTVPQRKPANRNKYNAHEPQAQIPAVEEYEQLPVQQTPYNSKFGINELCQITHINNPNRREYMHAVARITGYYHKRNVYEVFLLKSRQTWNVAEQNLSKYNPDMNVKKQQSQAQQKQKQKQKPHSAHSNPFGNDRDIADRGVEDRDDIDDRRNHTQQQPSSQPLPMKRREEKQVHSNNIETQIRAGMVCRLHNAQKAPHLNGQLCEVLEDMTFGPSQPRQWRVLLLNGGQDCEFPEHMLQPTNMQPPPRAPMKSRRQQKQKQKQKQQSGMRANAEADHHDNNDHPRTRKQQPRGPKQKQKQKQKQQKMQKNSDSDSSKEEGKAGRNEVDEDGESGCQCLIL